MHIKEQINTSSVILLSHTELILEVAHELHALLTVKVQADHLVKVPTSPLVSQMATKLLIVLVIELVVMDVAR